MVMTEKDFSLRLAKLREEKGVSARDMSLSMGQNPGYINNIESGKSMPSLAGIFYICEYLGITPKDFFDTDAANPSKANELYSIARGLSDEQLDNLIALAKHRLTRAHREKQLKMSCQALHNAPPNRT